MKQKLLYTFLLSFLLFGAAKAQQQVSGKVTDAQDAKGLSGVTVAVLGTSIATQSDAKGDYSLNATTGSTLIFSSIGYVSQQIILRNQTVVDVSLFLNEESLENVVVTGYGTQRKREVTGAISSIRGEALQNIPVPSLDKALQGQAAGVQVSTTSGILGQAAKIRIRGTNSISSSSSPLFVVDGVPFLSGDNGAVMANNPLADINPNDIESLEVLKDGAATAIYGSRAANGVILIVTKKGRLGKPIITYDAWVAAAKASKFYDLMDADQFIEIANEKLTNAGFEASAFETKDPLTGEVYNTDWQKEIFRTGLQHNHVLSYSGATEQANYYFSGGFMDMQGVADANSLRKYTLRGRAEQKAFDDKLTVGFNTSVTNQTNRGFNSSGSGLSGNVGAALYAFPNVPAKWADGSYNFSPDGQSLGSGGNTRPIYGNYINQRYVLDNNIYKSNLFSFNGSGFVNVEVLKGLSLRSQIGVTYQQGEDYLYWNPLHGDGKSVNGRIYQYSLPRLLYNWQNTINYALAWNEHRFSAVVGTEYQKSKSRYFFAHGYGLSSIYFGENENIISGSLANQLLGGGANENAFNSFFGRLNYTLLDRYFLSGTLRYDKLSALPFGSQGALLPGVSLGWDVVKEPFFTSTIISQLKIRGGYAKVGNTDIGNYPYAGLFGATQYGPDNAIYFSQAGNSSLKFETSYKSNVGVDVSFLENRVNLTLDYFNNNIDNMILEVPTPPSLGVPDNRIYQNVGKMYNRGIEASISGLVVSKPNFSWSVNLNATYVKNKVTQLYGGNPISYVYHRVAEGEALGSFYGYESAGVNSANGNALFYKKDGSIIQNLAGQNAFAKYNPENPTNISETEGIVLSIDDKKFLGQGDPKWYGGFSNTFVYKNIDLALNFSFAAGHKVYNVTRQETLMNMSFANTGKELLDRWTSPGQITDVPKVYFNRGNMINQDGNLNSRFLENGSFLRAQRIGLGYNLSGTPFLNRINIDKLRFFATVDNVFVITSYSGLDPDLARIPTQNGNAQPGLDNRNNPIPRTFTLGINVGF